MSANPSTDDSPSAAGSPPQVPETRESQQHEEKTPSAEETTTPGPEAKEREEIEQNSDKEPGEEPEEAAAAAAATESEAAPPLPDEVPPPLPNEVPPGDNDNKDDGWEPVWDPTAQAYYFYNRFTGISQWENPRVPDATAKADDNTVAEDADTAAGPSSSAAAPTAVVGGYNPAIHGDYDPTAPYAQQYEQPNQVAAGGGALDPEQAYVAVGAFNRFTGRWQAASQNTEYHNDENKSHRQMYAFFDVDAAANSHDGRSLRAERSAKKLTKKELKMFKEKRREKKEEKRRAWLRD
ncbi:WW domain-containing protein [Aspergillus luchuensis]|uniref:WW domain protein n=1 Tax=Aspergillus kawachii TaxID=1069201 RepID=A0A146F1S9_ASPKA|nr:uncharacterized protein AKAW2_11842A [Aspergillus luchuensis]BCR94796.1 hypothetical protein AKAW2_11842A [Aspergillus luchuensis]BCS07378.1 hypothetical protein ALUC_11759A [Aspergillus luchuensis]GAA86177.1 WW domain protein [Aspergillus luchuensis IFO 4308]GAT19701.1 WW domain protein [Aspergillus luchuensis]